MLKLPKMFRGRIICHVFTVHNAEKEGIFWRPGRTFFFFGQKGGHVLQMKDVAYGKPTTRGMKHSEVHL